MLVIVGYVRIRKGRLYRHGEGIAGVRREGRGRRQKSVLRVTLLHAINALSPVAGSSLVQTPFLYLRIPH
jgi:hypothetical protein